MSIAILGEVYNETRRLAIAGSGLAIDDFRLKKLIAPLEKAGAKSPVFAKVAAAIQATIESDAKKASGALLELSTLVTAILYTQGSTGADGRLKAIETSSFELPTSNSSARVLKPLIEALTTTGSGRLEIITDAHGRGAFKDLRLVKPALHAVDDVYAEIAEFVAQEILTTYGKAILPDLRESWNVKGSAGHVRRLQLMHRIDPEGAQELVEQALENGNKDMKIAAIGCLKDSKGHLGYMLEQTKARAKDVRRAAFNAIAKFTESDVLDSLMKALSGEDVELVAEPVSRNRSPKLLTHLLEEADSQLAALLKTKDKAKLKKGIPRFCELLGGFVTRTDKKSMAFLKKCFDQREAIGKLKGGTTDGDAINLRVISIVAQSESKPNCKALVEAHESLLPDSLGWAMVAAAKTMTAKKVFDVFSPYYTANVPKKRGSNPLKEKQEVVCGTLHQLKDGSYQPWYGHHYHYSYRAALTEDDAKKVKLAPEWLDAAIAADDLSTVRLLARPKHKATNAFLVSQADKMLSSKSHEDYHVTEVIDTMLQVGHPKAVDYFMKTLEKLGKKSKRYNYAWWIVRLIPDLPKTAVKRLEEILPTLSEQTIDAVIPYVEQLKAK